MSNQLLYIVEMNEMDSLARNVAKPWWAKAGNARRTQAVRDLAGMAGWLALGALLAVAAVAVVVIAQLAVGGGINP